MHNKNSSALGDADFRSDYEKHIVTYSCCSDRSHCCCYETTTTIMQYSRDKPSELVACFCRNWEYQQLMIKELQNIARTSTENTNNEHALNT